MEHIRRATVPKTVPSLVAGSLFRMVMSTGYKPSCQNQALPEKRQLYKPTSTTQKNAEPEAIVCEDAGIQELGRPLPHSHSHKNDLHLVPARVLKALRHYVVHLSLRNFSIPILSFVCHPQAAHVLISRAVGKTASHLQQKMSYICKLR